MYFFVLVLNTYPLPTDMIMIKADNPSTRTVILNLQSVRQMRPAAG